MLDFKDATEIVKQNLPNGDIQLAVPYRNMYLYQVFRDDPGEEKMDPYFSVNRDTGYFSEFSLLTDGNISEIVSLFEKAKTMS